MFHNLQKAKTFFNFREPEKEPVVIQISRINTSKFTDHHSVFRDYDRPKFNHAQTTFSLNQKNGLYKGTLSRPLTKLNAQKNATPVQYISMSFKSVLLTKTPRMNSRLNSDLNNKSKENTLNDNMFDEEENEYKRIRQSIILPFDSKSIEEFNAYSRGLLDNNHIELNDQDKSESELNKSSKLRQSSQKSQKTNKQDSNSNFNSSTVANGTSIGYNDINSMHSGMYGQTNAMNSNGIYNENNNSEFNRMQGIKKNTDDIYGMNSGYSKTFGLPNNLKLNNNNQNKFSYNDYSGYNHDDDDEDVNFANSLRVIKKNSSKSKKFTKTKTIAGDYSRVDAEKEGKENAKLVNSLGDDWLLKWSILSNKQFKKHEEVFNRYDILGVGHLSGPMLVDAISSVYKLTNNQMNYLFNILNLCEIDPFVRGADFNMFKIITCLAEKITNLDEEWFFSLLPKLDISSVENKAFKIRSLWNYLVNTKTKMLTNHELMIEFEAGGVTKEHIDFARRKFSDKLYFEITDYITYIPLFLCIHSRIIKNPLGKYEAI